MTKSEIVKTSISGIIINAAPFFQWLWKQKSCPNAESNRGSSHVAVTSLYTSETHYHCAIRAPGLTTYSHLWWRKSCYLVIYYKQWFDKVLCVRIEWLRYSKPIEFQLGTWWVWFKRWQISNGVICQEYVDNFVEQRRAIIIWKCALAQGPEIIHPKLPKCRREWLR